MSVSLDILGATNTLGELANTIQQTEDLGYSLLSVSVGVVGGAPASLVTFSQGETGSSPPLISLEIISGGLSKDQQETKLNEGNKQVVCYGALFVQGQAQNVVAYRVTS